MVHDHAHGPGGHNHAAAPAIAFAAVKTGQHPADGTP